MSSNHSTTTLIQHAAQKGAGLPDTAIRQVPVVMKDGTTRIIGGTAASVAAQIAALGFAVSEV